MNKDANSERLSGWFQWLERRIPELKRGSYKFWVLQALKEWGKEVANEYQEAGYLFNNKFYKDLDSLKGETITEENKPIKIYKKI